MLRKLLEDQLAEALRDLGFQVLRGVPGAASDLWVRRPGGPWINVECRNRAWEVVDRLESRDRTIFRELADEGLSELIPRRLQPGHGTAEVHQPLPLLQVDDR